MNGFIDLVGCALQQAWELLLAAFRFLLALIQA